MSTIRPEWKTARGFSIVAAIFIIVVLALIGTTMVQLISTGSQSISQEITSLKAYLAGQSGLQWGMYQATYAGAPPVGPHAVTFSSGGLTNTQAAITLQQNSITGETVFLIQADGSYGNPGDREYSLRSLELRYQP